MSTHTKQGRSVHARLGASDRLTRECRVMSGGGVSPLVVECGREEMLD